MNILELTMTDILSSMESINAVSVNDKSLQSQNASRFSSLEEEEISKLIKDHDNSDSTKKSVRVAVRALREYIYQKGLQTTLENISLEQLNSVLRGFYVNARKKNGEHYSKNALNCLRYGIARYFNQERGIDIINDKSFLSSNQALKGAIRELAKIGKCVVLHYPPIDKEDLRKIYHSFNTMTPVGLQNKVMFDIMFYLCHRSRENMRSLTKYTFQVLKDDRSNRYICMVSPELNKKSDEPKQPRMYECKGSPYCPVTSYIKYLSKLNPDLDCLWQRAYDHSQNDKDPARSWYQRQPVGIHTLRRFLRQVSRSLNLTQSYSNYSIRATPISLLDELITGCLDKLPADYRIYQVVQEYSADNFNLPLKQTLLCSPNSHPQLSQPVNSRSQLLQQEHVDVNSDALLLQEALKKEAELMAELEGVRKIIHTLQGDGGSGTNMIGTKVTSKKPQRRSKGVQCSLKVIVLTKEDEISDESFDEDEIEKRSSKEQNIISNYRAILPMSSSSSVPVNLNQSTMQLLHVKNTQPATGVTMVTNSINTAAESNERVPIKVEDYDTMIHESTTSFSGVSNQITVKIETDMDC